MITLIILIALITVVMTHMWLTLYYKYVDKSLGKVNLFNVLALLSQSFKESSRVNKEYKAYHKKGEEK